MQTDNSATVCNVVTPVQTDNPTTTVCNVVTPVQTDNPTTVCDVNARVRRPIVVCTAECKSATIVAQCLAPVVGLIGVFLCEMCKSTDKIPACAVGECDNCYYEFCTFCGRGCHCSQRYLTSARIATYTIRRYFLRHVLSDETCEHRERNVETHWYYPECRARVPLRLLQECNMSSFVCGGAGYKCRLHVCPYQEDKYTPTDFCTKCRNDFCTKCRIGCKCMVD